MAAQACVRLQLGSPGLWRCVSMGLSAPQQPMTRPHGRQSALRPAAGCQQGQTSPAQRAGSQWTRQGAVPCPCSPHLALHARTPAVCQPCSCAARAPSTVGSVAPLQEEQATRVRACNARRGLCRPGPAPCLSPPPLMEVAEACLLPQQALQKHAAPSPLTQRVARVLGGLDCHDGMQTPAGTVPVHAC